MELTETEITCLRWMRSVNRDKIGLFYPTVRRLGPLPECSRLVDEGLATLATHAISRQARGYWITAEGRRAIRA